jgi:hypothetical protein
MVILTQYLNGFGNCLLLTSHFLVNAVEHDYELAIPAFESYAPYFEGTASQRTNFLGRLPVRLHPGLPVPDMLYRVLQWRVGPPVLLRLPWLPRLLGVHLVGDVPTGDVDLNSADYLAQACGPRPLLVHGWQYRDKPNFARYGDLLRRFFRPIRPHRDAVAQVLATNRAHADVLVGVHIRRGDYAGWCGGAYLYTNATYVRAMREMRALFPEDARVRFLLFSNEPIPAEDFAEFDTGRSTDHPLEDLYAMAGCDYIIGPLSTYSMWASFYGRVPLCHLHGPDHPVESLEQFVVFEDQETVRWESEKVALA